MTEGTAKFFLLQVNDALFPIGGYSHSYGLETYIQKGIVHDEDSAQEFIHKRLKYNFSYNEFMAVRLAFEYALREDLEAISRLEEIMEAGKIPRETREASRKLGSRFIKTLSALEFPVQNSIFDKYREARKGKTCITRWPMVSSVEQQESPKTKHWNILSMHRPLRWSQTA